ncbi:uncharacterized protein B0P05DRAFT_468085 [Gilbertella persicaria]|uniref:uncharacterized protein n=1 Tax=Gilbertella persicaria TaxID=101096 RepID=UPI00221E5304|nr:uncharacterized protein B0P05DRAFT_468085 [Gilbertella persicaria]KAI8082606.1 hypothetical protein B0P05DRAFT_468085 [Gilbertella persicaria]
MHPKEARKVIAVDFDQTLAHTLESLVKWHNDTYSTNFSVTDFNTYDYWKIWGGTREESCMKIREFYESEHFEQIEPIRDFALEALKMLKRRHFTLVIITSRQQFIADKTKKFVDKHYPGIFESIYFCNLDLSSSEQLEYISKPKSLICQEIGVDVLIDDSLEHALDCSSLGIDILLYDRKGQYRWNHEDKLNIHRMKNWREIIAQFPKPSSPLRFCYYPPAYSEEEEEEEEDEDDDGNSYEQPAYQPSYYGKYETVEVEELSDEDEAYPIWKENRVWV